MITEEQIKNLKKGDKLLVDAYFVEEIDGYYIRFSLTPPYAFGSRLFSTISSCVSLPSEKPKHDPYRRFREGDRVSPCAWQDRAPTARMGECCIIPKPGIYEVLTDELHEMVSLRYGGETIKMHICFLELVTPVEEIEPFYLDEITDEDEDEEQYHCFMIKTLKGEDKIRTYYSNKFETIAQTKAAAEAERDRLNAEHRKDQNDD